MQPREEEHSGKKYFKTEKKICLVEKEIFTTMG